MTKEEWESLKKYVDSKSQRCVLIKKEDLMSKEESVSLNRAFDLLPECIVCFRKVDSIDTGLCWRHLEQWERCYG